MKSFFADLWNVYRRPVMMGLLGLGFSSGLPRLLVFSTLTFWLLEVGISIKSVGLFAATALPYTLKVLWAPMLDRFSIPVLGTAIGKRRGWIVFLQIACAGALFFLATTAPESAVLVTAFGSVLLAFFSASLDVVIDGYRVELLDDEDQGAGAAAAVLGYRLGMIVGSAGALYLAAFFESWNLTFFLMGAFALLPVVVSLLMPRIENPVSTARSLRESIVGPFQQLSERFGGKLLLILAFVILYKFGDAMAGAMANPLYVELKFEKMTIANVAKTFGIVCSIIGVFIGGVLVRRGLMRALVVGCIIQCASNLMFVMLAKFPSTEMLTVTIAIENISGGIGTAAFVAYLSALCSREFSATQYAFLTATASVLRTTTTSFSGFVVAEIGMAAFFGFTSVVALPALLLLYFLPKMDGNTN